MPDMPHESPLLRQQEREPFVSACTPLRHKPLGNEEQAKPASFGSTPAKPRRLARAACALPLMCCRNATSPELSRERPE